MRVQWRTRKGGPVLSYRCANTSIAGHTCGKQIVAKPFEDEVWAKLTLFHTDPDAISISIERMRTSDPTRQEQEMKTRLKADHEKAQANLMASLARQ